MAPSQVHAAELVLVLASLGVYVTIVVVPGQLASQVRVFLAGFGPEAVRPW